MVEFFSSRDTTSIWANHHDVVMVRNFIQNGSYCKILSFKVVKVHMSADHSADLAAVDVDSGQCVHPHAL